MEQSNTDLYLLINYLTLFSKLFRLNMTDNN